MMKNKYNIFNAYARFFTGRALRLSNRGKQGGKPPATQKPSLMALEPRYMYDAAGIAALDEFKNLIYENGASKIAELEASSDANEAQRDAQGRFDAPDSLAFPVFHGPAGGELREEFEQKYEPATLQDIPTGPEGSSVYALSGAFSRPLLQGNPIGYLWTAPTAEGGLTDLNTQEYFELLNKDLEAGKVPQSEAERMTEALMWRDDVSEEMQELQDSLESEKENLNDITDITEELWPHVEKQVDSMSDIFDAADLDGSDAFLDVQSPDEYEADLKRMEAEERVLFKELRLEKELETLDAQLDKADAAFEKEMEALDAAEDAAELDKAENVYLYDSDDFLLYSDYDNMIWRQFLTDMKDMDTVVDAQDDSLTQWMEENADIADFGAPLDKEADSAQSQKEFSDFDDGVSDILQRLEKVINDSKDRK